MSDASSSSSGSGDELDLDASELGTHEYWQSQYAKELQNFRQHDDEGEIWFGSDTMGTMVDFMHQSVLPAASPQKEELSICDLGTGNAVLLVALAQLGYRRLQGSDYSTASIQLAEAVLAKHGLSDRVTLVVDDLLDSKLVDQYDVLTDKGTLDAVGLSAEAETNRKRYVSAVSKLLRPGGLLVLTSCNSTKEELVEEFCGVTATRPADGVGTSSTADLLARVDIGAASGASISCQCSDSKNVTATQTEGESAQGTTASKATLPPFELVDWVKTYPTFRFGGFEGTRVCTVAFCRLP